MGVSIASLAVAAAAGLLLAASAAAKPPPLVPRGDILAVTDSGGLEVLDRDGTVVGTLLDSSKPFYPEGLALSPDRRHVFASLRGRIFRVNLKTGRRVRIGRGFVPVVSADRRKLAWIRLQRRRDITYRRALVVRDLRTGRTRSFSLGKDVIYGTPPDNLINLAPHGRRVALRTDWLRLARVVGRGSGAMPRAPTRRYWTAPAFLTARKLVVLKNCCIGRQRLVVVDLRTGKHRPFATLPAPPETLLRFGQGGLVAVTALRQLVLVRRHHRRVIAREILTVAV